MVKSSTDQRGNSKVSINSRETWQGEKKKNTRHNIRQASLKLFVMNGFENVTLKEIAETANVSSMTVFRYFQTKEDIVYSFLPGKDFVDSITEETIQHNDPFLIARDYGLNCIDKMTKPELRDFLQIINIIDESQSLTISTRDWKAEWMVYLARVFPSGKNDLSCRIISRMTIDYIFEVILWWSKNTTIDNPDRQLLRQSSLEVLANISKTFRNISLNSRKSMESRT